MKKLLLLVTAFLGLSGAAQAACTGPAVMHDFPGTSFNMSLGTTPDGNCGSNVLITTWGGVTLGAASNYGTSPGTVAVPGVNAFVTNTVAVSGTFWQATQPVSGTFWQATQPVSVASGSVASGAYASGAFAVGSGTDGWDVTLGAKADSVCGTATGTCTLQALIKFLNQTASGATPAGTNVIGFNSNDPCSQGTKIGVPINLTASGQVLAGTASKKTYICSLDLVSATAQNIALVEGTGTVCATNIFGLAGGTTAATGWNLSANGGLTKGSGAGTVYSPSADTNATAANLCLLLSGTGQTSGQMTVVQQ